jgi:1-acyl-sn-glycerol-3-phosphate acyltransferase
MRTWRRRLDYASRVVASGLCFAVFGLACMLLSLSVFPLIRLTAPDAVTTRRRVRQCVCYGYRFIIGMGRRLGVISYELHGGERLAAPGQLVVANHPSLIDVLFIGARMPQVDCIVKAALLRNPFLGAPLRWADYIPNGAPEHLIEDCVATLRAGNSLLVFPEGTRSVPGQPLQLKRGAAHIALAAGVDLLPVTIVCHPSSLTKTDVWYRVPRRRPHWRVVVGAPIRVAELCVAGESESRAARRVTAHLAEYFSSRIGLPAVAATAACGNTPLAARSAALS